MALPSIRIRSHGLKNLEAASDRHRPVTIPRWAALCWTIDDQDDCGEGHDPEEFVTELGAGRHVGDPVARIDETDRDEEAGPDITEQFQ